jgi:Polyketide cyclase / dehydrase and lipid transport
MPSQPTLSAPLPSSSRPLAPMKQILGLVALVLVLGVCAIAGTGLMLATRWNVEAEVLVAAPPARIFPLLEDFRRWPEWEAKKHDDPEVRYSFTGPAAGVGAAREFTGKRGMSGMTRITKSDPAQGVWFESSLNGREHSAAASITYQVDHEVTKVVWKDSGDLPKFTGVFLRDSVESRLKIHMQESLKQLKQRAELVAN